MLRRPLPVCVLLFAVVMFSAALTISSPASAPAEPATPPPMPAMEAVPARSAAARSAAAQQSGAASSTGPGASFTGPAASFTGPGSCAAAACHGSVRPVNGSRILQTEYSTWVAQDRHARATEVLSSPVSARMGRILGIGAASAAPKCLACHSLAVPEIRQARTFANDGVSCESCHGPASAWLGPHTTRGWTHAQSVQLGMHDTKDLVKRTERCLSCHLGTAEKEVDHEMIAAGHPDLVFDLEAYSAAMPRHWKHDADPMAAVRSFSVGQLVHVRSGIDRLARRTKGPVWPEFAELDCFACHHSLTRAEDSWRQTQGYENRRPGNVPLNQSRWAIGRHVLAAYDAKAAADLDVVMTRLALETSRLRADTDQIATLSTRAREILDRGVARAVSAPPDGATATRLFRAIAGDAESIAPRGERAAEQAAMAMDTLYAASAKAGGESPAVRAAFDELFQQFQSPSSYDPRRFVAQVRRIEGLVR